MAHSLDSTMTIIQMFTVRLVVPALAASVFGLFALLAVADGLVQQSRNAITA